MSYEEKYKAMRAAAVRVQGQLFTDLVKKCQENPWLKVGGVDFDDGLCCEHDYPYYLERYEDVAMLQKFFEHGNWGPRTAVQFGNLIFVNQVNGGDEWWTLKVADGELIAFESISFQYIIERGEFPAYIKRLVDASAEDCRTLNY